MENNFQLVSAAVSDKGLSEKRPQNEDSFLDLNQSGLFAVADGVGGAQAGDVASQMAVEILSEAFINMPPNGDAEEIMKLGIEKANSAIFQMSRDLPQLSTMATTLVALNLQGNIATVGHVGDSRLYRLDGSGNLYRETQDHSIVEEEVRAGRMTPEQAVNHPSRNVISRALGAEMTVEVDLKTIMFEPNTLFLLCSDGITRHIEDHEIRSLLNSSDGPAEICRQMKKICYQRGAEDNLTAVIISISNEISPLNSAGLPAHQSDFEEEQTVATARLPLEFENIIPQSVDLQDGTDTGELKLPANASGSEHFSNVEKTVPEIEDFSPGAMRSASDDSIISSAPVDPKPVQILHDSAVQPQIEKVVTDEKNYRVDENADSGFFGKLFSSLLLLIVGAIIGVGIYYFAFASNVQQPTQPPPQITQMQTPDISFSSFEKNRRNVDQSPETFIAANAARPQDAEDYFLLGRAYLLTGKYAEAKQALMEAKNRLAQVNDANNATLAKEIAISMAIINDPFAQKSFEKDLAEIKGNSNSATNSGVSNSINAADSVNGNVNLNR